MSQITRYAPEAVFPAITGWPERSMADHRRVLAALAAHDQTQARAAMAEHLAAGVAPLLQHLTGRGVVTCDPDGDAQPDQRPSPTGT